MAFVNILSEKLSDEDIRRIFSFRGEIKFPEPTNNAKKLKTEEQIVINFKSRDDLIRTMAAIHTKVDEIRKNDFTINDLPDDCLVPIFSFLPLHEKVNIDRVCQSWRNISDLVFAETKELDLRRYRSQDTVHSILKRCGPSAKILKLSLSNSRETLEMVQKYCQLKRLREIHLRFDSEYQPSLFCSHLRELLEKATDLESLVMRGYVSDFNLDPGVSLRLQTLKHLKIWNMGQQESLVINLDDFPNLRELNCRNIEIRDNEGQINPETTTHIERLELYINKISTSFIKNIKFRTNLRKIILEDNDCYMNTDDILDIVKNCQNIQELYLDDSFVLTPQSLQEFGRMSSLETLHIRSIGNDEALHLQHLTNLKQLTVSDCHNMSEHRGLIQLITNSSKLSKLSLTYANMLDQNFAEEVVSIFSRAERKTPLTLKIHVERGTWSIKYKDGFDHPLLKLELREDYFETDHSELEEMEVGSGIDESSMEGEEDTPNSDSSS